MTRTLSQTLLLSLVAASVFCISVAPASARSSSRSSSSSSSFSSSSRSSSSSSSSSYRSSVPLIAAPSSSSSALPFTSPRLRSGGSAGGLLTKGYGQTGLVSQATPKTLYNSRPLYSAPSGAVSASSTSANQAKYGSYTYRGSSASGSLGSAKKGLSPLVAGAGGLVAGALLGGMLASAWGSSSAAAAAAAAPQSLKQTGAFLNSEVTNGNPYVIDQLNGLKVSNPQHYAELQQAMQAAQKENVAYQPPVIAFATGMPGGMYYDTCQRVKAQLEGMPFVLDCVSYSGSPDILSAVNGGQALVGIVQSPYYNYWFDETNGAYRPNDTAIISYPDRDPLVEEFYLLVPPNAKVSTIKDFRSRDAKLPVAVKAIGSGVGYVIGDLAKLDSRYTVLHKELTDSANILPSNEATLKSALATGTALMYFGGYYNDFVQKATQLGFTLGTFNDWDGNNTVRKLNGKTVDSYAFMDTNPAYGLPAVETIGAPALLVSSKLLSRTLPADVLSVIITAYAEVLPSSTK